MTSTTPHPTSTDEIARADELSPGELIFVDGILRRVISAGPGEPFAPRDGRTLPAILLVIARGASSRTITLHVPIGAPYHRRPEGSR